MLIACWVAMTGIGLVATGAIADDNLSAGEPARLLNAIDVEGRICGHSKGVEDKPNAYYMLNKGVICIKTCPSEINTKKFICVDGVTYSSVKNGYQNVLKYQCMYEMETKSMLNRCVSSGDTSGAAEKATKEALESGGNGNAGVTLGVINYGTDQGDNWFSDMLADIYDNSAVIFGIGLGLSNVIALAYLYILRIPGVLFTAIWGILLSIQFALVVGGAVLYMKYTEWSDDGIHSEGEVMLLQVAAYAVITIAVLYAFLMLVMRKRVQLALAVIKEAARAMASMPGLILMPLVQALGLIVFLAPWMVYCIYLASSGDVKTYTATDLSGNSYTMKSFEYNTNTRYAFLYMLFSYFWTSQFIVAFGQMSIALALVAWYFTHDKKTIGNGTVIWAMKTVGRYHLGTCAYGALVIALIKTIRAVLMYIQKKLAKSENKILAMVVACIQCCMWCVEKCMKFLNKNAYIQTAIYGTSFCKSARKAFFMIARNILRVAAVNMVGDFVLFLGRLFIPTATTFIAYFAIAYQSGGSNGIILPLIFVWICAYFIGCMYSEIFGMSIETVLNCYVADEEMFPPELRFAEGSLRDTMANTAKAAADQNKIAPAVEGSSASSEKQVSKPAAEEEGLL
jgi:hypothetical protein